MLWITPCKHALSFYKYYYFNNIERMKSSTLLSIAMWVEKLLRRLRLKKKIPFKLFSGSQWVALTRDCVEYILKTVAEDKRYEKIFGTSRFTDETFFILLSGILLL